MPLLCMCKVGVIRCDYSLSINTVILGILFICLAQGRFGFKILAFIDFLSVSNISIWVFFACIRAWIVMSYEISIITVCLFTDFTESNRNFSAKKAHLQIQCSSAMTPQQQSPPKSRRGQGSLTEQIQLPSDFLWICSDILFHRYLEKKCFH